LIFGCFSAKLSLIIKRKVNKVYYIGLAVLSLSTCVVFSSIAEAGIRPVIYGQSFSPKGGELFLKISGNNFLTNGKTPNVYMDNKEIVVDSYIDSFIKAVVELPIGTGSHDVFVSVGAHESATRAVVFTDITKRQVDELRVSSGLPEVDWNFSGTGVVESEEVIDEVIVDVIDPELIEVREEEREVESYFTSVVDEVVTEELPFTDLHLVPWVSDFLPRLFSRGAISGFGDGTFRPNWFVTRGEALKMIMESLYVNSDYDFDTLSFCDVSDDHWLYKYAETANALGVIDVSSCSFNGGSPISRFEVVKMLFAIDRSYNSREYKQSHEFSFSDVTREGNELISPAVNMQIINSVDSFRPYDNLTRAEWSKILDLFLERRNFTPFILKDVL
jgi:hypothetical protein